MRGVIFAATAAAGVLFLGALGLFASYAGGVRWQAFERPVGRLGRVPAVEAPDEPAVLTMTASDVDSVPEALEARPRAASRPQEPAVALGDVEPSAPRAKAPRKAPARKSAVLRRVGLGGARRALELGAPAAFDGGGSGAFSGGGREAEVSGAEDGPSPAPAAAAPARRRAFRAMTPAQGTVAPAPAPAAAQEDVGEEPDEE